MTSITTITPTNNTQLVTSLRYPRPDGSGDTARKAALPLQRSSRGYLRVTPAPGAHLPYYLRVSAWYFVVLRGTISVISALLSPLDVLPPLLVLSSRHLCVPHVLGKLRRVTQVLVISLRRYPRPLKVTSTLLKSWASCICVTHPSSETLINLKVLSLRYSSALRYSCPYCGICVANAFLLFSLCFVNKTI